MGLCLSIWGPRWLLYDMNEDQYVLYLARTDLAALLVVLVVGTIKDMNLSYFLKTLLQIQYDEI